LKCVLPIMLFLLMAVGSVFRAQAEPPALVFPPMTGSVIDAAQMLDSQTSVRLSKLLRAHEQATGERVVVVTLADLQGASLEDFGARLGDAWGLGRGGKANSVLMLIHRDKRKVFIEVGSGVENRLTGAQSSLIVDMLMMPEFNEGRFAMGIERGTQAVVTALGGQVPDYPELSGVLGGAEEQGSDNQVWLLAMALTLVVLIIVAVSIRRGATGRVGTCDEACGRNGGRFGGGGASGNW